MTTKLLFWFALTFLLTINSFAQLPPETAWGAPQVPHPPTLTEPAYLQTIHDADYETDFIKISDTSLGNTGAAIQHQYSKVQAWNADMSLIALGFNIIINADDYSLHTTFSPALSDARWSHTDPEIRFYGDGEFFKKVNVATGVVATLHQFPGYGTCTIGPWEGNISADDRYVVVTSQNLTKASVYDILNDVVISSKNFPSTFDWISVTPWGNYVAVSNNNTDKTELYDLNFNFIKNLSNFQSHADFAIDSDGHQVLVEMCPIRMVRLDNLQETDLLPATAATVGTCGLASYNPYVCGHVSGRSFTPGWVLISAGIDDCNNGYNGYYHRTEIFLLKLDGSGTVKKFGFSRSTYSAYLEEAKASISPDGLKVIFTSDWDINGNGGNTVDYIVEYGNGTTYDLTSAIPTGNGSISPSSGTFGKDAMVLITATPASGYAFDSWGGDLSENTNPTNLTMDTDKHITASFVAADPLLAYWKMDESSGHIAVDSGPNGLGATLGNPSASSYSTGILNGALNINNSNQDAIILNANIWLPV